MATNFITGARTERVILPSRLRRGRAATAPVWRVTLATGAIWEFQRRKDALAFAAAGQCLHHAGLRCSLCGGFPLVVPPPTSRIKFDPTPGASFVYSLGEPEKGARL